jgi:hypothetical protein
VAAETTGTDTLSRLLAVAEEQLRWQRASVLPQVRDTVERTLMTSQLRQAYELCDGSKVSSDIAKAVGTSKQNFSGWTRRWRDLGIAFENEDRKIQHLTSLKALGIALEAGHAEAAARGSRAKRAT